MPTSPVQPSSIMGYRDGVVSAIKAKIPVGLNIEPHDGYFDLETIERLAFAAPAVFIAVMNAKPTRSGANSFSHYGGTGQQNFDLDTVCFVVATDLPGLRASELAWAIGEQIANLAVLNAFTDATLPALDVSIENLWSNKTDKRGLSLLSVSWHNQIVLGTDWSALSTQLLGSLPGDTFGDSVDPTVGLTLTVTETIGESGGSTPATPMPIMPVPPTLPEGEMAPRCDAAYIAAVPVFAGRAVMFDGAQDVEPADPNAVTYVLAGIATQSVAAGAPVIVQNREAFRFSSWNWVAGQPVFVLANGVLSQIAPDTGVSHQIGSALDATTIVIEPGDPIYL